MNIIEATKASLDTGKWICRVEWEIAIVKPTNDMRYGYIIWCEGRKKIGRFWNPQVEDILANDWELTDKTCNYSEGDEVIDTPTGN